MISKKEYTANAISLSIVLFFTVALVILKIIGAIAWPWIWVISPLWGAPLLGIYMLWIFASIGAAVVSRREEKTKSEIMKEAIAREGIEVDDVPVQGVCPHDLTGVPEA